MKKSPSKLNLTTKKDERHFKNLLQSFTTKLITQRQDLSQEEITQLIDIPLKLVGDLAEAAHQVRLNYCGPVVEVEGILSAKTGGCSEDCHFCSQSAHFQSKVKPTPFLSDEEILKAAYETKESQATEFCIVLAIKGPSEKIMQRLESVVPMVREKTGLNVAVSAGILTLEQANRLKAVGTHRYNHNLETAASFFPNIVTTHSWQERFQTCLYVKESGMQLCSGLIFGLGESPLQRVEALCQLRELDPEEVPLNFLNPRPGTPLADRPILDAREAIKWIAIARLALSKAILRYAGGREITLKDLQAMGMKAGINALIVGNYLTTLGRNPNEDLEMLAELKMPIGALSLTI
jgi:biotin synthase